MTEDIPATLLLDPDVIADPQPFYRLLQAQAPVWRVPGTEVFVVSAFALLEEATRRVEDFSSNMHCLLYRDENGLPARLPFGDMALQSLATADPPLHGVHKRAVFPEFVGKRMALLEPEIVEITADCLGRALDLGAVDFMDMIGNRVPITVVSRLIGFRDSDLDALLRAAFQSVAMLAATRPLQQIMEYTALGDTSGYIADQLALAATEPGDDILTSVGRAVESGTFGAGEGVVILQTLLAAGGESTTSLLGNAVRMLADDPALQQRLRENPELIPAFVEEAGRLEPPFRHHMRWVARDTTLGGVDIPAGATALMFWGAANRDPAQFERPDEIILDRPRRHVTFGHGIHQCVGAPLARLEARVVLTALLERTSNVALDPDQPPRWVDSLMVRRYERLAVRLDPR